MKRYTRVVSCFHGYTGSRLPRFLSCVETFEFFYNSSFPAKSWQDPASIDIQWSPPIECQCWQDPAMIWQEISNCRKPRLSFVVNRSTVLLFVTYRTLIRFCETFMFQYVLSHSKLQLKFGRKSGKRIYGLCTKCFASAL